MPGPHIGIGNVAVADWWLVTWLRLCEGVEETEAAAAPAMTTATAKARTASFIISNSFCETID
jgi:hypothetical protein